MQSVARTILFLSAITALLLVVRQGCVRQPGGADRGTDELLAVPGGSRVLARFMYESYSAKAAGY